jgi:photosynthetic reaction center cytochrome c subunit
MNNRQIMTRLALAFGVPLLLAGCERPPPDVKQIGYRGTAMELVQNPRLLAELAAKNQLPPALEQLESPPGTPLAKDVYQNVQVLTDLDIVEFTHQMTAQANWIAPEEQCAYCHNLENFASDEKYTKVVARRMLSMTRDVNINWQAHVKQTGVTCYTCHRGKPVPEYKWFQPADPRHPGGMAGNKAGQNTPALSVLLASLPYDPLTPYLLGSESIKVKSATALPTGENPATIMSTEHVYGLMMVLSGSLGVNCTFCHNSQHFGSWELSPPQRVNAWHGIRMVRHLNNDYLVPLTGAFPAERLGPTGDVAKIYCATCHQGLNKPLNGVSLLPNHPELARIRTPAEIGQAAALAGGAEAVGMLPPANIYFELDRFDLPADAASTLAPVVTFLKSNPDAMVVVSGYHDPTGNLEHNLELARNRAFAVRDFLVRQGIALPRIDLAKPVETTGDGSLEEARRVEVSIRADATGATLAEAT